MQRSTALQPAILTVVLPFPWCGDLVNAELFEPSFANSGKKSQPKCGLWNWEPSKWYAVCVCSSNLLPCSPRVGFPGGRADESWIRFRSCTGSTCRKWNTTDPVHLAQVHTDCLDAGEGHVTTAESVTDCLCCPPHLLPSAPSLLTLSSVQNVKPWRNLFKIFIT